MKNKSNTLKFTNYCFTNQQIWFETILHYVHIISISFGKISVAHFYRTDRTVNPKKTGNNKRTKATWRKYVINNE